MFLLFSTNQVLKNSIRNLACTFLFILEINLLKSSQNVVNPSKVENCKMMS